MKILDILETQQVDEVTLKQVATAGIIGAAAMAPQQAVQQATHQYQAAAVQQAHQAQQVQVARQEPMVQQVVDKYNIDQELAKEVVRLAHEQAYADFPTAKDILAIVGIESSFRPHVQSQLKKDPARGLMQVRPGVWNIDPEELDDIETNIQHGATILHKYYAKLRSKQAAVQAYNIGITSYRQGETNPQYLSKYQQEYGRYVARLDQDL